jgi:hypothetical protein
MRILKAPMKQRTLHNLVFYRPSSIASSQFLVRKLRIACGSFWKFGTTKSLLVYCTPRFTEFLPLQCLLFKWYLDLFLLPVENQMCTATLSSLCLHFVHFFTRSPRFPRSPYLPQSSVSVTLRKSRSLVDYMQVIRVSDRRPRRHGGCVICMALPLHSQRTRSWLTSPIPPKVVFPQTSVACQQNFTRNSIAIGFDLDLDC